MEGIKLMRKGIFNKITISTLNSFYNKTEIRITLTGKPTKNKTKSIYFGIQYFTQRGSIAHQSTMLPG